MKLPSGRRSPTALSKTPQNQEASRPILAVKQAQGKYCAFYEAADIIDPDQVEKAIRLMEEHNYDIVQSTVFRKDHSILSHFLPIDTVVLVPEIPAAAPETHPGVPAER